MTRTLIEAPSDAQLALIARMLAERGLAAPDAVASKQEASEIVDALRAGRYNPERYAYPWGIPFR